MQTNRSTPRTSPTPRLGITRLTLAALALASTVSAQTLTGPQSLAFAGLRSVASQGQFNAVATDPSGNIYLLLDQKDGVRILKTDPTATHLLAQSQLGAKGDIGLALVLDPAGNVYIAGTSTSGTLAGTSAAAFPGATGASTNSFVAKYDANLNNLFVTFAGTGHIAATSLAATSDAVFLTGSIFASTLPVTPNGIQQTPAQGSSQNGFVERFSSTGSTLVYATYLTGANGNTSPASIVADTSDNAYIAGFTSASGYPTIAALVPIIPGAASGTTPTSGFLTKITPLGDGITFSTFIPGTGITSLALDAINQNILLSGTIALGQFPVATVQMPLVSTAYQTMIRMPLTGASVLASTLLAPGTQSYVAPGTTGTAWVDGLLSTPLLPLDSLANTGTAFTTHISTQATIDQTARFGGLASTTPNYASAPVNLTSIAADPTGQPILAGSFTPTTSSSLLPTQLYDLALTNTPTSALPSSATNAALAPGACNGSLCSGSAAYLAKLSTTAAPSLALSIGASPDIILRNLGTAQANNLQLAATGFTVATTCTSTLAAGAECDIALTGSGPGTLTAQAANATTQTAAIPATTLTPTPIVFSPRELDFGIQTTTSAPTLRTLTITNLSQTTQTFTSALDAGASKVTTPPFSESSSTCATTTGITAKTLAAGATCQITFALALNSTIADGPLTANWTIAATGSHDVLFTGYANAAALSPSVPEIDFGTQFVNGLRSPRYLYLSNNSDAPITHTTVALPTTSPFTVTDLCPDSLAPHSVCQLQLTYLSPTSPTDDSVTLSLDQGISVLVTGQTIPQPGVNGASVNPSLSVTPTTITFANAVPVTSSSSTTQTVTIGNTGATPFTLNLDLTGDFTDTTNCPATLAGGASCSVVLTFTPTAPGTRDGLLSVTAGAGTTPIYVSLSGTATAILPANNGTLDFGYIPLTQPSVQWYKVSQSFQSLTATATGAFKVILVEDLGFGYGNPSPSAFASTATGTCLNCYIGIQFTPTTTGFQTASLTLTSSSITTPYVLTLTGTGLPFTGLVLTPTTQDFGSVPVHSTSQPFLVQLTNLVVPTTTLTLAAPTTTGDFAISQSPSGGQPCTGTLALTATCYVEVTFSPTSTGPRTGTVTIQTSAGPATATLTGFATPDPGLALSPNALTFQNVPGATATLQTITLTNTGPATLQIGALTTTAPTFTVTSNCAALAPAATCAASVTYTAANAPTAGALTIPVTSTVGGAPILTTYTALLTGAYTSEDASLEILPNSVDYGPAAIANAGLTRTFTINNLTAKPLTLTLALPRQFAFTTGNTCQALTPNGSCAFAVTYAPLTAANVTGTIFAQANPNDNSGTLNGIAYVEGYGTPLANATLAITGPLSPGTGILSFGQVTSGQSLSKTLTLTNTSVAGTLPAAPITIRRITSEPPFLSTTTCGATLMPTQSCTITITYTPTNQVATGSAPLPATDDTGTITIESDALSSPNLIDITGSAGPVSVTSPSNASPLAIFALSASSLTFPATVVGDQSPTQTVTLSNTGTITLNVTGLQTTPDYTITNGCSQPVVPGATCTLSVAFNPQSTGTHSSALEIATTSGTSLDFITLFAASATPSSLTLSTSSLNFGTVLVGSTAMLPIQVTNNNATPVVFAGITATGNYTASGSCPTPGNTLAPATSCTIQVTFAPATSGTLTGTLSIATSASTLPLTVALTGIGAQSNLVITPTSLAFGNIAVGSPANLSLTLTNTGTASANNITLAITGPYAVTVPCSLPALAPGQTCTVTVTFTPIAIGAFPGTLTITSSDPSSPVQIPLTGAGIQNGTFTLTVDGANTASTTVVNGFPAIYNLTVTPLGTFSGNVVFNCTPLTPAQFASCSILPSSVTLAGTAQNAVLSINTVTSISALRSATLDRTLLCLLAPGLFFLLKTRRRTRLQGILWILFAAIATLSATGCGGGANPNLRYTLPGTYQFQVTASSTSGIQIVQSVTVTMIVTN